MNQTATAAVRVSGSTTLTLKIARANLSFCDLHGAKLNGANLGARNCSPRT
jgi:uncharacterized protein YjbI with pentapeptide repeats